MCYLAGFYFSQTCEQALVRQVYQSQQYRGKVCIQISLYFCLLLSAFWQLLVKSVDQHCFASRFSAPIGTESRVADYNIKTLEAYYTDNQTLTGHYTNQYVGCAQLGGQIHNFLEEEEEETVSLGQAKPVKQTISGGLRGSHGSSHNTLVLSTCTAAAAVTAVPQAKMVQCCTPTLLAQYLAAAHNYWPTLVFGWSL